MAPNSHPAIGIALALAAFAFFSTMDMLVKLMSAGYPLPQIIFFLSLFAQIPLSLLITRHGGRRALRTRRLGLHLLRGTIGLCGGFCSFFAYSRMPLTDVYAIAFSAPLFVTALSVPFLGEHVGWRRWSAVAVGFLGVLVMLHPGPQAIQPGMLGALGGALSYSCSVLLLRRMTRTETAAAQMFYPTLLTLTVTGLMLPFVFIPPNLRDLAFLLLMGLCGGSGQICLIHAFAATNAAIVAPFQYSQMLWGTLYGFLLWQDRPDAWMLTGAGIVIASGLYILHRETIRHPAVTTAAKGATAVGAPILPTDNYSAANSADNQPSPTEPHKSDPTASPAAPRKIPPGK